MSGISDRACWYLTFPRNAAYDSQQAVLIWKHIYYFWGELSQGDMGVPPWEDPARWTRNSPVYRAGQVTAPLLLVSGNTDSLGSEAMFTALERQGKKVRFLHFADEPHYVSGYENFMRLWDEIFTWLAPAPIPVGRSCSAR